MSSRDGARNRFSGEVSGFQLEKQVGNQTGEVEGLSGVWGRVRSALVRKRARKHSTQSRSKQPKRTPVGQCTARKQLPWWKEAVDMQA